MSGGGSGGGAEPDREYNARMATIAEQQQAMANELFQYWKSGPGHWETVTTTPQQITASSGLGSTSVPVSSELAKPKMNADTNDPEGFGSSLSNASINGLSIGKVLSSAPASTTKVWVSDPGAVSYQQMEQAQMKGNLELIPKQVALQSALLEGQTKVAPKFFEEAMNGIDVEERVNRAAADVESAYAGADKSLRRYASGMGINPASNRYLSQSKDLLREKAAARVGATSLAQRQAEEENFARLSSAMGLASA